MEHLKISSDEMGYIAAFEASTGASVKYCMTDSKENKILFVVKKGDMGLAVGKRGSHIHKVRKKLGKNIAVVEYSEDPAEFVRNIFNMYRVKNVSLSNENKKIVCVEIDERDKMLAIGMNGKKLQKARALAKKLHDIDNIVII